MAELGKARSMLAIAAMAASMSNVSGSPDLLGSLGISKGHTPNKYQPHQGAKEKARRLKRLQRRAAVEG